MININDIAGATQFAALIAIIATLFIVLLLRPKSHK